MTARPTPAERLLAMLGETEEIEALPAAEVRADLEVLGVDPGRVTAFARGLAAGRNLPAGRLLAAIDDGEAAESEIARLEGEDIAEIRRAVPEGSAAAVAAEARRRAGGRSNVVGIRRRRGILVWGGAAGGVAASLLVAMVLVRDYVGGMRYAEAPMSQAIQRQQRMAESDEARDDALAKRQPAAPAPSAGGDREAAEPEAFADRPAIANKPAEGLAAGEAERAPTAALHLRRDRGPAIAAMLLVDPARAPVQLQGQAMPAGDLEARLDEARRLAGERAVIALYSVESEAGRQDFVQVPLAPRTRQQLPAPSPLARLIGSEASDYDFIPLPGP